MERSQQTPHLRRLRCTFVFLPVSSAGAAARPRVGGDRLALGVGLVVTVTAAAAGVKAAQGEVLHSLYGVGTDITVTEPATPGSGGGFHFGWQSDEPGPGGHALQQRSPVSSSGLTTFSSTTLTSISKQNGVSRAAGALTLTSIHVTGTFPSFSGGGGGGGMARPHRSRPSASSPTRSMGSKSAHRGWGR